MKRIKQQIKVLDMPGIFSRLVRQSHRIKSNASRLSTSAEAAAERPLGEPGYAKIVSAHHWIVGTTLLGTVGTVLYAQQVKGPGKGTWMFRHKSLGLLTGILVAPRILSRLMTKDPSPLAGSPAYEHTLAKISHGLLYGWMLVMPVTGIAMGYYGGKGLPFFTTTFSGAAEADGATAKQAFSIHKTAGVYGKYLVPIHIGAAGYHAAKGQAIFARINPFR